MGHTCKDCKNFEEIEVVEVVEVEKEKKSLIRELFEDENNILSSKRILGTICVLVVCIIALGVVFLPDKISPPEHIINAVAALAFGLLGLSSVDKFSKKVNE